MKKLRRLAFSFLFFACLVLTSCGEDDIAETVENTIPNLYVTLAQLGAFIVMVVIVIVFGYKPIKKKLDQRKHHVESNIMEAQQRVQDAKYQQDVADANVKASRVQAQQIVEAARKQAEEESRQKQEETEKELQLQRENNAKEMKRQKEEMERQLNAEAIGAAVDISKQILGRELTKDDNDKIIDEFLDSDDDKGEDK